MVKIAAAQFAGKMLGRHWGAMETVIGELPAENSAVPNLKAAAPESGQ